jgi:hypothetical protein
LTLLGKIHSSILRNENNVEKFSINRKYLRWTYVAALVEVEKLEYSRKINYNDFNTIGFSHHMEWRIQ